MNGLPVPEQLESGRAHAPGALRSPVISAEAPLCFEEGHHHSQITLIPSLEPSAALPHKTC